MTQEQSIKEIEKRMNERTRPDRRNPGQLGHGFVDSKAAGCRSVAAKCLLARTD